MKKIAFTMAEILITLGVIGIIAALIIPQVMAEYRKRVVGVELQKQYAALNQVIERAKADHGDPSGWSYWAPTELPKWVETYILPYVEADYIGSSSSLSTKLKPMCTTNDSQCGGTAYIPNPIAISMKNSSIAWFFANHANGVSFYEIRIIVYLKKKPLRGHFFMLGREVFTFNMPFSNDTNKIVECNSQKRYTIQPFMYCYPLSTILGTGSWGACNQNARSGGYHSPGDACGALIMRNGWKVPDDYPVRF